MADVEGSATFSAFSRSFLGMLSVRFTSSEGIFIIFPILILLGLISGFAAAISCQFLLVPVNHEAIIPKVSPCDETLCSKYEGAGGGGGGAFAHPIKRLTANGRRRYNLFIPVLYQRESGYSTSLKSPKKWAKSRINGPLELVSKGKCL